MAILKIISLPQLHLVGGDEQRVISSWISLKSRWHYKFKSVFLAIPYKPLTNMLYCMTFANLKRPSIQFLTLQIIKSTAGTTPSIWEEQQVLIKNLLQEDSARQLQTYATSSDLTTAATRLFRCYISGWHVSSFQSWVLSRNTRSSSLGSPSLCFPISVSLHPWRSTSCVGAWHGIQNLTNMKKTICKILKWKNLEACLSSMKFLPGLSCFSVTLNVHDQTIILLMSGGGTPSNWLQLGRCLGLCVDVPLRRPGDVHACRLRHVGDRMLPCQECLQRLDEEPGERFSQGGRKSETWTAWFLQKV